MPDPGAVGVPRTVPDRVDALGLDLVEAHRLGRSRWLPADVVGRTPRTGTRVRERTVDHTIVAVAGGHRGLVGGVKLLGRDRVRLLGHLLADHLVPGVRQPEPLPVVGRRTDERTVVLLGMLDHLGPTLVAAAGPALPVGALHRAAVVGLGELLGETDGGAIGA